MKELCDKLSAALAVTIDNKGSYNEYFSASVLVPLVWDNGEIAVLFEVRSTQLSWQPGEICFPGGRIEKNDKSPLFTAVRETQEELALSKANIQVLGPLEEILSPIGVRLHPYVGYLSPQKLIIPNEGEVAEIFTVPLEYLINYDPIIGYMEMGTRPLDDFPFALIPGYSQEWRVRKNYQVLFYKYEEHVIWGLTAQVLKRFLDVCKKIDSKEK